MTDEHVALRERCAYLSRLANELEARLDELEAGYEAALVDLNVQLRFWRQCAEHAVTGWNALEDKVEAARELLGGAEEWAPPMPVLPDPQLELDLREPLTVDLGGGTRLRIVEDETMRPDTFKLKKD